MFTLEDEDQQVWKKAGGGNGVLSAALSHSHGVNKHPLMSLNKAGESCAQLALMSGYEPAPAH